MEKSLLFADDLMPLIRSGIKKSTLRKGRRDVRLGMVTLIATKSTCEPIEVTTTKICFQSLRKHLDEKVYEKEGYVSAEEFLTVLYRFYPDVTLDDEFTAIEWE